MKPPPAPARKKLTADELAALMLLAAFILGAYLRLNPAAMSGFPLNDGGMFYTMIQDLRQNNYALPAVTTYNHLDIPYTYPPLPFYLAGFLADGLKISLLQVLLWLPALVNLLTLPAFALLARALLASRPAAALATLIYALTPLSMDWFLMGGGLTRGLGQLGLILVSWSAWRLFTRRTKKDLFPVMLSGALLCLSHPESALLAVITTALIWLCLPAKRQTIPLALLAGAGLLALISPWLVTVLRLHGYAPFLKAAATNGSQLMLWTQAFTFDFTQESGLALVAVLGLIGLFMKLSQRDFLLPAWVLVPFFINPRSSSRAAIIALAMLAALSLMDLILPALARWEAQKTGKTSAPGLFGLTGGLFTVYLVIYLFLGGYGLDQSMAANHLGASDHQAMDWISQHTPPGSRFIVLTGETQLLRDPIQEWFPALTGRSSLTTLQGREWTWGGQFITSLAGYQALGSCLSQDLECLRARSQQLGLEYDSLYIHKQPLEPCIAGETCRYNSENLVNEVKTSSQYKIVFENAAAVVAIVNR